MASLGKTAFRGGSGKAYRFRVYALGARFRKLSGLYVFASRLHREEGGYRYVALQVGHTEDFSELAGQHGNAEELTQRGANCVCLQKDPSEESRLAKHQDLVAAIHALENESD